MNRFALSSIKHKNVHLTCQIGDIPKYATKGFYTSPKFDDSQSGNKWNLLVYVYERADYANFIEVWLKRDNYVIKQQLVNVKMAIVNCFGSDALIIKENFSFESSKAVRILSVAKAELKSCCGLRLKKILYLPYDTLTLQCDIVEYENNETYKMDESFLNNIPPDVCTLSFVHSRLINEDDEYFIWQIRDFSLQISKGRCISPGYQSERLGGMWSLIVRNIPNYSAKFMDIRLARLKNSECQMVKTKLAIMDRSGRNVLLLSKEKHFYVTNSEEIQLLSKEDFSSFFGPGINQLTPDDTLTLRWDIGLCKQIDDKFTIKEDFDNSVKTCGYSFWVPPYFIPYLKVVLFVLVLVLVYIFGKLFFDLLQFICYSIDIHIKEIVVTFKEIASFQQLMQFIWLMFINIMLLLILLLLLLYFLMEFLNKIEKRMLLSKKSDQRKPNR